ncbi:hypothetical protein [Lacipirellula sp.]|uniref:hypothetical protein n=1 Tax=Lacipirellula sp. TaxID=2691419 RepID=UPI003D0F37FA
MKCAWITRHRDLYPIVLFFELLAVSKAVRPTKPQSDPTKQAAPNVLDHDFTAEKPNQKWVTDIS